MFSVVTVYAAQSSLVQPCSRFEYYQSSMTEAEQSSRMHMCKCFLHNKFPVGSRGGEILGQEVLVQSLCVYYWEGLSPCRTGSASARPKSARVTMWFSSCCWPEAPLNSCQHSQRVKDNGSCSLMLGGLHNPCPVCI